MSYEIRYVEEEDLPRVEKALRRMQKVGPPGFYKNADEGKIKKYLASAIEQNCILYCAGYVYLFFIAEEWFSGKDVLYEELFIRVDSSNLPPVEAAEVWEEIARKMKCSRVVVGDTYRGLAIPSYVANGYEKVGQSFFKDIK